MKSVEARGAWGPYADALDHGPPVLQAMAVRAATRDHHPVDQMMSPNRHSIGRAIARCPI